MITEAFSEEARRTLLEIMAARRDVRTFEVGRPLPHGLLEELFAAAHLAPSVGFSQPWRFLVIRDEARRERIRESFLRCRHAEAARYPEERRAKYLSYRLEGIAESAVNVCVTVDLRNDGEHVLGTTAQPEAVRASVVCAVQNLWLCARAHGVGVGWVSIVEPEILRQELALPPGVEPVAYLCIGYPKEPFGQRPLLEETKWRERRPLAELIFDEEWPSSDARPVPEAAEDRMAATPVASLSQDAGERCRAHWATIAAPKNSLGALERLAVRFAEARGDFPVPLRDGTFSACIAIFAADHGVVVEGVSAYPSSVTAAMVATIARGRATVNALARAAGAELRLFDVGLRGGHDGMPTRPEVPVIARRVRAGTDNLRRGPAMSLAEANVALEIGVQAARDVASFDALGVGEVGIGNTTSAAALICALTGLDPRDVVGRGTGLDEAGIANKVSVVRDALARLVSRDPIHVLSEVGGFELAAMAGFIVEAARARRLVVLDGFLSCASAIVAHAIDPAVTSFLVASHRSTEKGAALALDALGLEPLVALGLGVGEGSGAALGLSLLRTALTVERDVATFATMTRPAARGTSS
ncbi:Nicotinate-nucleotide--dimethylbenzimidazole phosphoribosyltransferase [Labilithrix luteola]|uniref:Nicotinate-nucleotide--dimethylbenzimidazole phosphoribosyltransferase n=1 Tax=Labilithrix luteola TaxID=1391654 RepID=A0A0K1Q914_9BACT|nr:nicotinate-nucleotide--dimethylbenzimidazole phosphoribosyltransferase [Labilithrix luteola]AKV02213.1 Nicotinate-nucleotide--dimethylbenzimidazole phosphoribosyltransferase [Labilithrix luteola]